MADEFEQQPDCLKDTLGQPLRPTGIEQILPVIVPRSYFRLIIGLGRTLALLRHQHLGITCAILKPNGTMLCVNNELA